VARALALAEPTFASGGSIDDLVAEGLLHPECSKIFRPKRNEADTGSRPITLHRHQREAIETARSNKSYVLTTGTGSGKSLAYIIPIVDRVLRQKPRQPGVKAIIVYPMNALANSQSIAGPGVSGEHLAQLFAVNDPVQGSPPLRIQGVGSDPASKTWKSAHEGAAALVRGAFMAVRNLVSHPGWPDPAPGEALEMIAVLSHVAHLVGRSDTVSAR
jgi:primosomal protein N'